MGTAWRELGKKKGAFDKILNMVSEVNGMGLEVCCTLGMVNEHQAKQLKEAGLTAYNHNLDTSREHYPSVISTRTYDDRLQTIKNVRAAGISVCCGGILGIGDTEDDRIGLLHELSNMPEHPESVPINALVPIEGTPMMEGGETPDCFQMARTIATARIIMPRSMVRLSAGRMSFSPLEQAVMFLAGANSIFTGDKLLTTANPKFDEDMQMFENLGMKGKKAFSNPLKPPKPQEQPPQKQPFIDPPTPQKQYIDLKDAQAAPSIDIADTVTAAPEILADAPAADTAIADAALRSNTTLIGDSLYSALADPTDAPAATTVGTPFASVNAAADAPAAAPTAASPRVPTSAPRAQPSMHASGSKA
jgi:biotin synthase